MTEHIKNLKENVILNVIELINSDERITIFKDSKLKGQIYKENEYDCGSLIFDCSKPQLDNKIISCCVVYRCKINSNDTIDFDNFTVQEECGRVLSNIPVHKRVKETEFEVVVLETLNTILEEYKLQKSCLKSK